MYFLPALFLLSALAQDYSITARYPVPGNGGFDYIVYDSSADRLYVSHGNEVDVVNAGTGKVLGKVENTPGVHGIAIVPELHRGFTTNGGNATVSVFDTETFKTLKSISVPKDPDFTLYDKQTKRVLVCHGDAAVITAIDPNGGAIVGTVQLGGGAEAAVTNARGLGFVNLEESAQVVQFDTTSYKVQHKWPITGCKTPTGLAMDVTNNRLFIGCRSKVLAIMDATNGKVIQTLPIGDRVDAVTYDPATHTIFASNGGGTLSIIQQQSADKYESGGEVQTQVSAKTMAYDPKSRKIFLSAAEMNASRKPKPDSFQVLVVEKK